MESATKRQLLGLTVGGGVVAGAAVTLSPGAVFTAVGQLAARPVLFVAVLVVLYLARPFVLWPISAISVLVGFVYGPVIGVPVALAGAVLTSLPPFLLARYTRTDAGLFGSLGRAGNRLVEATGALRGIVGVRLAPLPPDPVAYAAGLSGVGSGWFVLGTLLGELPWVAAAVLAGHSMERLAVAEAGASLSLLIGAAAFATLLLGGPLYRLATGRHDPT
jgi:Uncharacterized conserved protein